MKYTAATAALTDPKNKLSSRVRRRLQSLRERAIPSEWPLVRKFDGLIWQLEPNQSAGVNISPEDKLERKLKTKTWVQLHRDLRRAARRRAALQFASSRIVTESPMFDAMKVKLDIQARWLNIVQGYIQQEINSRKK